MMTVKERSASEGYIIPEPVLHEHLRRENNAENNRLEVS